MKKIFTVLIAIVMSCAFSSCNFFQKQPAESPALLQSSLESESAEPLSSEELALLQKQAEKITDCLVSSALTPEMRKAVLAEGKLTLAAAETEMTDELIWYFMRAVPLYREGPDFPYASLVQLSEDRYTFYFPIHEVQQMALQLFGRENWLPEIAQPCFRKDAARFEIPAETGAYTVYSCTEIESSIEPDGHITVTFQLIDAPSYPGLERYGKHCFNFAACQGEDGPYLQLQSCEFIKPATPLSPEPPDGQLDLSSPPPEFLNEEQQELYLRARTIAAAFWLETDYIDNFYPDDAPSKEPRHEINASSSGNPYYICTGRYRQWIDFERMMRSLFTWDCFMSLCYMETDSMIFFEGSTGLLCYYSAINAGHPKEILPDEYRLIDRTDEFVSFEVTRHYLFDDGSAFVGTYPMQMALTDKGWRFDEFGLSPLTPSPDDAKTEPISFESYFENFASFFHSPATSPAELPLDSNFAYFLLYETYHAGIRAGKNYTEENQFYLIPENELAYTAKTRLGIENLDLSDIEAWPFWGVPPEGMQLFTEATSLPYLYIVEKSIRQEGDRFFADAVLETFLGSEGEPTPRVSLSYEFRRISLDDGTEYYQLISITDNGQPPETSQPADLPTADTVYYYHVPNPKPLDLEALITNFSRLDQEEDILEKLPDSRVFQFTPKAGAVQWIISEGWSFAGTQGTLLVQYHPESGYEGAEEYALSTIDYWTLNQELEGFGQLLDELNGIPLSSYDDAINTPFAFCDIWSPSQEWIPAEKIEGPYLPSDALMHCSSGYFQNLHGEPVELAPDFLGADEAAWALSWIWQADESLEFGRQHKISSATRFRIIFSWDIL